MSGFWIVPVTVLATLFVTGTANASTDPEIISNGEVKDVTEAVLFCNLTSPPSSIDSVVWMKGEEMLFKHVEQPLQSVTYTIRKVDYHTAGEYVCLFKTNPPVNATILVKAAPHVTAYKTSENGNEGEKVVLICKSSSYPPVMWSWYKMDEKVEINTTDDKYRINSVPEKTELHIQNLDIKHDQESYICEGVNEISAVNATIFLRVRSRLAALWPFLGIVAEVIVLVTVIFIYEKRRKPDEVLDDDDAGATPLKSNAATNHKDENVRQRNSN